MGIRKRKRRFERALRRDFQSIGGHDSLRGPTGQVNRVHNRKAMQLCRQVEQTLHLVLAGCADAILQELLVTQVQPFLDSSRLLVSVQAESEPTLVLEGFGSKVWIEHKVTLGSFSEHKVRSDRIVRYYKLNVGLDCGRLQGLDRLGERGERMVARWTLNKFFVAYSTGGAIHRFTKSTYINLDY
jgi:hypothetical protein